MNHDIFTFDVNEEILKIRAAANTESISEISKISSATTIRLNFPCRDKLKFIEIKELIRRYARHWGETEENIDKYIENQLASYSLGDLINCFRLLNADI